MATLIYALNSGGRGHTFRALAVVQTLRQSGHEVVLCCGGAAKTFFEERGEKVVEVPALEQVIQGNRGSFGRTVLRNARPFLFGFDVVRLVDTLHALKPDLLISDFEPFATLAAELMGLRVLALEPSTGRDGNALRFAALLPRVGGADEVGGALYRSLKTLNTFYFQPFHPYASSTPLKGRSSRLSYEIPSLAKRLPKGTLFWSTTITQVLTRSSRLWEESSTLLLFTARVKPRPPTPTFSSSTPL